MIEKSFFQDCSSEEHVNALIECNDYQDGSCKLITPTSKMICVDDGTNLSWRPETCPKTGHFCTWFPLLRIEDAKETLAPVFPLVCPRCGHIWIYSGTGSRAKCNKCKKDLYYLSGEGLITVDLTLSPGEIKSHSQSELRGTGYVYIDCWNRSARLNICVFADDAARSVRCIPLPDGIAGITEADLQQAIEEAGGAINISGYYPLDHYLMERLRRVLP